MFLKSAPRKRYTLWSVSPTTLIAALFATSVFAADVPAKKDAPVAAPAKTEKKVNKKTPTKSKAKPAAAKADAKAAPAPAAPAAK